MCPLGSPTFLCLDSRLKKKPEHDEHIEVAHDSPMIVFEAGVGEFTTIFDVRRPISA